MASPIDDINKPGVLDQLAKPAAQTQEGAPKAKEQHTPAPVKPEAVSKVDAMNEELKAIELESAKLELQLKQANLVDMQERLQERELKRANVRQEAYTKGSTLAALASNKATNQKRCNHKKGGNGAHGVVGGQGDDSQYAVLKHTFANGDTWVKCLRCHKTWKPPVASDYKSKEGFEAAQEVYTVALGFMTRNSPSSGVQFRYSDGGAHYRENTKQVQLG